MYAESSTKAKAKPFVKYCLEEAMLQLNGPLRDRQKNTPVHFYAVSHTRKYLAKNKKRKQKIKAFIYLLLLKLGRIR